MSMLLFLTCSFYVQTPSVDSGVASHLTSMLPSESEGTSACLAINLFATNSNICITKSRFWYYHCYGFDNTVELKIFAKERILLFRHPLSLVKFIPYILC